MIGFIQNKHTLIKLNILNKKVFLKFFLFQIFKQMLSV